MTLLLEGLKLRGDDGIEGIAGVVDSLAMLGRGSADIAKASLKLTAGESGKEELALSLQAS